MLAEQAEQQGDETLACVGLVCYGLEEARHLSVLHNVYILLAQTFSLIHVLPLIHCQVSWVPCIRCQQINDIILSIFEPYRFLVALLEWLD